MLPTEPFVSTKKMIKDTISLHSRILDLRSFPNSVFYKSVRLGAAHDNNPQSERVHP